MGIINNSQVSIYRIELLDIELGTTVTCELFLITVALIAILGHIANANGILNLQP